MRQTVTIISAGGGNVACYGSDMMIPKPEYEAVIEDLIAAQMQWRADDLLFKRAERAARNASPADKFHIRALIAALRYDEEEAMRCFENAAKLAPGEYSIAWNHAATAVMFGRWDVACELFAGVATRFDNQRAREREIGMLRFCGRFREAASLAEKHGLNTPDAMLAGLVEAHGLDETRIAELFERVGGFLREQRLPALGDDISLLDAEEGLIEAAITTPCDEPLDDAFVDYMDRFAPLPAEESVILIGFEPCDGDSLARAA